MSAVFLQEYRTHLFFYIGYDEGFLRPDGGG